jgi:hypothetical protein
MSSMENNIDHDILVNIIDICSKISGVKKSKILLMSSINNDLKIDGDDIVELIECLVIKYNLNTEKFEYSKYFDWEGQINIISQIKNLFKPKIDLRYDVKIYDLYQWVVIKEWSETSLVRRSIYFVILSAMDVL